LAQLQRVVEPVLSHLAEGRLRKEMPVECPTGSVKSRRKVTHLEAVGRTLCGIAPWLELEAKRGQELSLGSVQKQLPNEKRDQHNMHKDALAAYRGVILTHRR
ncbi:MAG: DUF2264 domain-containing protein, partial [Terriglobia bacterium]